MCSRPLLGVVVISASGSLEQLLKEPIAVASHDNNKPKFPPMRSKLEEERANRSPRQARGVHIEAQLHPKTGGQCAHTTHEFVLSFFRPLPEPLVGLFFTS